MTDADEIKEVDQDPAIRNYVFLCLTALVLIFLVLVRRGMGGWSFLPVIVGLLGAGLRWRLAPILCLILLAGLLYSHDLPLLRLRGRAFRLEDWILSAAVLAYFAGHYRLQGLTISIFPVDPRRSEKEDKAAGQGSHLLGDDKPRREPRLVSPSEIGWLVLSLPIFAFLAQWCWILLPEYDERDAPFGLESRAWQGMLVAWLLALGLCVAAGLLDYLGRMQMNRREATLILQDILWRETCRDQRRLQRWLAWASFRRRRRKGQS